jgi:hypothetical protein
MASARRSFLELPPRKSEQAPARPRAERAETPLLPAVELTSMPISFGVLLLALGVNLLMSLSVSWVVYRNAVRSDEASRASERRLTKELTQLKTMTATLQAQLELRAQDIVTQARELERVSAELESVRGRGGFDARARARRVSR